MDIYSALKNGTSEKELREAFEKDLKEAKERIHKNALAAAEEKAKEERIKAAKEKAEKALASYYKECGYTIDEASGDDAFKAFFDFEPMKGVNDILMKFVKSL